MLKVQAKGQPSPEESIFMTSENTNEAACPHCNRGRKTKIIATLGPATESEEQIRKLFESGVDVFRLNFSHGDHEGHQERLNIIRSLEKEFDKPVAVIADLQGPKLRIGQFKDGKIALKEGMTIRLDLNEEKGDETRVCLPHPEVIEGLKIGVRILLDDGKVRFRITEKGDDYLIAKVEAGIVLSDRKGFNIPDTVLPLDPLTPKDRTDLDAALTMDVDWIAQSFVQKPEDLIETREIINGKAALMAKLEKPSALDHLEDIIDLCDGIMVARGDLGVEIPPEDVPPVQKKIIRRARLKGKPVVVATQMLDSMTENPAPTRAEASDVATAVYDGADAVMLSAETAAGNYPAESVAIMARICERVEQDALYHDIIDANRPKITDTNLYDAIVQASVHVAEDINAACIVNFTSSGSTALRTARQRPMVPILCLTERLGIARKLALCYAVHPVVIEHLESFSGTAEMSEELVKKENMAKTGDRIVITAGVPFGKEGSTNIMHVPEIK